MGRSLLSLYFWKEWQSLKIGSIITDKPLLPNAPAYLPPHTNKDKKAGLSSAFFTAQNQPSGTALR